MDPARFCALPIISNEILAKALDMPLPFMKRLQIKIDPWLLLVYNEPEKARKPLLMIFR